MDTQLTKFVDELAQAAGTNLLSVVLYGSAASGDFHAKHSDLNLLCLFDHLDAKVLAGINPATQRWTRKRNPAPLVFAASELARAADVFAIELVDIQASHTLLYGTDLVAGIEVPMALHHLQVERELRQSLVRLRGHYLAGDARPKTLLALMTASVSSFATLFRHAALPLGAPEETSATPAAASRKREAFDRLARIIELDARPFHTVLDLREGKVKAREMDARDLFARYLAAISHVVHEVDVRLEERTRG